MRIRGERMNNEIYNLFVSGGDDTWESNSAIIESDRCFEYTSKELSEKYKKFGKDEIAEIKNATCIFAYEDYVKKDAYIGYVTDIIVRQIGVKVIFEKTGTLPSALMHQLQFELDMKDFEFSRTHWAIKSVDLPSLLLPFGISFRPTTAHQPVDITTHFFDVAFTFAGESRSLIEPIVKEVEKELGANHVFYDNNYLSQLARPSLDVLLQDIYRNRSKLIVVFLCEKYQEKKWCGLEFRAIQEMIMDKEIEKIMYVRFDDGKVDGVFRTDGYIDGTRFSHHQLSNFICERFALLQ